MATILTNITLVQAGFCFSYPIFTSSSSVTDRAFSTLLFTSHNVLRTTLTQPSDSCTFSERRPRYERLRAGALRWVRRMHLHEWRQAEPTFLARNLHQDRYVNHTSLRLHTPSLLKNLHPPRVYTISKVSSCTREPFAYAQGER
jgi:hypothetical protein